MTIVSVGEKFQIFPDDLKTFEKIPAGTYVVRFHKMEGFSLIKRDDLVNTEKMYGTHEAKAKKTIATFDAFERSMGVILSGDKGIGKTMFARYLADNFVTEKDYPVIIVDTAYFGIADFLSSIKQEALILFDEFEKVFDNNDENSEKQDSLLSLFDGTSQTKHLYIVTVNDLYKLSSFMQNRTGRFHYHFRFKYPKGQEVRDYLGDKMNDTDGIEKVVDFSTKAKLTFDTLNSIAFELNNGHDFSETIEDLNINKGETPTYKVIVELKDHRTYILGRNTPVDLFDEEVEVDGYIDNSYVTIKFEPKSAKKLPLDDGYSVTEFTESLYFGQNSEPEYLEIKELFLYVNNDINIKYLV